MDGPLMVMRRADIRGGNASAKSAIVLFLAIATTPVIGCSGPGANDTPAPTPPVENEAGTQSATGTPSSDTGKASTVDLAETGETLDEYWRVSRLNGSKTGYSRMKVQTANTAGSDGPQPAFLVTVQEETRIQRFGQVTDQAYTIRSLMHEDGGLIAFEARLKAGGSDAVTRGSVQGDRLRIVNEVGGEQQIASIPWKPTWGGVGAADLLLKQKPLEPGEKRTIELLTPVVHQKMQIDLEALDWRDDVELPDGRRLRLLELKWKVRTTGLTINGVQWMDEKGEIQMSRLPSLNEVTYRTDRKTALLAEAKIADLGVATIVKLKQPLANPRETKRVVFSARLKHSNPADSFVRGLSQRLRSIDDRHAEIEVVAVGPETPLADDVGTEDDPPTPGDRDPNALIQSDDPAVVRLAMEVREEDPWRLATRLEQLVHQRIDSKNFSQAFASAADVAKNLEGDCTEHAVLLAALCRAKKIPARVAVGLVYFPREQGFAYHMWNEVWIRERWVPLDATLGQGRVGAERLKVASSNLKGVSPLAAFLPVLPLLQQLELEVVAAE